MKQAITEFSKYLLIVAHPDDEVNCAALLHRLITQGEQVKVVLLTNGDAGINSDGRVDEMHKSIAAIGLKPNNLILLGISEKSLLRSMVDAYDRLLQIASEYGPDCVLSLDYEGGHEGHDSASFIAHQIANCLGLPQIVFPDYHFRNMQRYGLEFQPIYDTDYVLELSDSEKDLKIKLLEAHRGQLGFYLRLQKGQDNYFSLLFKREVYRVFPDSYDFLTRPAYQIGYEYHRNGFKFSDFIDAAKPILDKT